MYKMLIEIGWLFREIWPNETPNFTCFFDSVSVDVFKFEYLAKKSTLRWGHKD